MELIHAFELSERFPTIESLNERITEDTTLSGGQKQRIVLIRALLQKKPFLILDEGLSALDNSLYNKIESYLLSRNDITLIHITHRYMETNLNDYTKIINFD